MRVGMVCPYDWSHPGGVRSHIVGLSRALRGRGVEVEIIAPASSQEQGVFVAGRTIGIPYNGSVARLCLSPGAGRRVAERLAAGDLDLLHIHEPFSPSVSLMALRQAVIPVVATFHASASRSRAYQFARPVLMPWMAKISSRIAVSKASLRLVSTYFPGRYRLVPNGIEVARFAGAIPDPRLLELKPFVLFVGRPEPRKGLHVAVEAVRRVRETRPVNLVAVGPTPADVPDWVHGLGPAGGEQLPGIYGAADVFCAPSLGGESFGIVLVEAAAAGVPVVCSDLPGYLEAAAGAALHAPAGDARATAGLISSVLEDPVLAADLVTRGRRRAAELDWESLVEAILESYPIRQQPDPPC